MADVLFVIMRWMHFASIATLIGGFIYGRLVLMPSLATLAPESRDALAAKTGTAFRPFVLVAVIGLIVSGTYNILTNPGHSVKYHMLLGVKLLLVMHVFAVAFLITQPKNPRRSRMMTGAIISGLIIIAIADYMRRIF
jgi:uncharacterized membrane protein